MSDQVSGRYAKANPFWTLLGKTNNVVNNAVPARSNLEFSGLCPMTDGALASTGVSVVVPVPWNHGDVVSKVSIVVGATAGGTITHQFAAIYSGIATPALIGQSTDTTNAAIASGAVATWTLTTPQQITTTQCPNGFIYAVVNITASTVPTAAVVATPTAIGYQWFTGGPLCFSGTSGTAQGATADATLSITAKAVAPIVILT